MSVFFSKYFKKVMSDSYYTRANGGGGSIGQKGNFFIYNYKIKMTETITKWIKYCSEYFLNMFGLIELAEIFKMGFFFTLVF